MKNNMKTTEYYKSGKLTENALIAQAKGVLASQEKARIEREEKIYEYILNPVLCKNCSNKISFEKQINNFCNKTCSATYNNKIRVVSQETKKKTSKALTGRKYPGRGNGQINNGRKIFEIKCKICDKLSYVNWRKKNHKTCGSLECKQTAIMEGRSYQNGKRKTIPFFNPFDNVEVKLESSWELQIAELLNEKNIHWSRPKPIKWIDENNKNRLYYPDFYLPKHEVFLDPKNPFCMKQDELKMAEIIKTRNVIYGDIDTIRQYVETLA
jgi:hypothetical protein